MITINFSNQWTNSVVLESVDAAGTNWITATPSSFQEVKLAGVPFNILMPDSTFLATVASGTADNAFVTLRGLRGGGTSVTTWEPPKPTDIFILGSEAGFVIGFTLLLWGLFNRWSAVAANSEASV